MYQLTLDPKIIRRLLDGAFIPVDSRNSDYAAFLAWVAAGNTATPADVVQPTQDELDTATARQYQKLRALAGMTPVQVQAWVDANVTDLASVKDAIKTLAVAVGILARRL